MHIVPSEHGTYLRYFDVLALGSHSAVSTTAGVAFSEPTGYKFVLRNPKLRILKSVQIPEFAGFLPSSHSVLSLLLGDFLGTNLSVMTEVASLITPLEARPLKNTICLFDVDGTLTLARQVRCPSCYLPILSVSLLVVLSTHKLPSGC